MWRFGVITYLDVFPNKDVSACNSHHFKIHFNVYGHHFFISLYYISLHVNVASDNGNRPVPCGGWTLEIPLRIKSGGTFFSSVFVVHHLSVLNPGSCFF